MSEPHGSRHGAADSSPRGAPYRPWVLVERAGYPESLHEGMLAVVDDEGRVRARWGDPSFATFPRSSAKPLQALPLIETGAADRFGLTPAQIAVCCASHSAEPVHVEAVSAVLAAAGADPSVLHCGPHPPLHDESAKALVRRGEEPRRIHNNCSGKHAGMIATSAHRGWDVPTYWRRDHPLQQEIQGLLGELGRVPPESIASGVDGCGVPAWYLPLEAIAGAAARVASARGGAGRWSDASVRVFDAMAAHPEMVAGTGRFDTELARAAERPLLAKGGAEGFHIVAWREDDGRGVALAAKAAAGDARSGDFAVIETLLQLGVIGDAARERLERFHGGPIRNYAGEEVGRRRSLLDALRRD
ncbi:MAG: asparaginase [bacterium]